MSESGGNSVDKLHRTHEDTGVPLRIIRGGLKGQRPGVSSGIA